MQAVHLITAKISPLDIFNNFENYMRLINRYNKSGIIVLPPLSFSGFNIENLKDNEAFLAANLKTVLYMKNAGIKNLVVFSVVLKIKQKIVNAYFFVKEGKILNVSLDKSDNAILNFDKINIKSIQLFSEKINVSDNLDFEDHDICMHYSNNIKDTSIVIYPLFKKELAGENYSSLQKFSSIKNCAVLFIGNGYFDGSDNCIYSSDKIFIKNGTILDISKTFEKREILTVDLNDSKNAVSLKQDPNIQKKDFFILNDSECQKIFNILTYGVATRLKNTKTQTVVIGVSGGSDSVLSLMILVNAFKLLNLDIKNIRAVTLPGFATSKRTFNNAKILIESLNVTGENYDISNLVYNHLADIENIEENIVYENAQARMRTLILMNLANKYNGMMIGTGDMSEMALGFCTFGGDQMSMYCLCGGIFKTTVLTLLKYLADHADNPDIKNCLLDVLATPISPELKKNVKSEDIVGNYYLNDYFLYKFVTEKKSPKQIFSEAVKIFKLPKKQVLYWLKNFIERFFKNAYKRNCSPDCVQVFETFIYNDGFKICSDASYNAFIKELDDFK